MGPMHRQVPEQSIPPGLCGPWGSGVALLGVSCVCNTSNVSTLSFHQPEAQRWGACPGTAGLLPSGAHSSAAWHLQPIFIGKGEK